MTEKGLIGQLMSFRNHYPILILSLLLTAACSDDRGKLVDKASSTVEEVPTQIASQNLPTGHPPIGGQGMADFMRNDGKISLPESVSTPSIAGDRARVASLEFKIDPSWISEKPQSSRRAAQFRLPAPEGVQGDGELTIFQGIGGSADANIQRWIGQFSERSGEPSVEKKQIGEFTVHIIDVSGTFDASSMMEGRAPQSGFRLIAAVLEGPNGGPWHIKLTGPEKTLNHWKPAFTALIDSLQITK